MAATIKEMIEVAACVICDGQIRRLKRALVAPFLATRIWQRRAVLRRPRQVPSVRIRVLQSAAGRR